MTQVHEDAFDTHQHLKQIKHGPDETFYRALEVIRSQYQLPEIKDEPAAADGSGRQPIKRYRNNAMPWLSVSADGQGLCSKKKAVILKAWNKKDQTIMKCQRQKKNREDIE